MTRDRRCSWCESSLTTSERLLFGSIARRRDARFCSRKCRQAAFRARRRASSSGDTSFLEAATFAYADPPYPGHARECYGRDEVDHAALVASLNAGDYAGWALSTSSAALRDVLPLCPEGARVCAWVKPLAPSPKTYGLHSRWEALIVVGGRKRQPGVRDWIMAAPARFGGDLIGRKPLAFVGFLWDALGAIPGDSLNDLFPGTGIVTRAWRELSSRSSPTLEETSSGPRGRRVARDPGDASPAAAGDGSVPRGLDDASSSADVAAPGET